MPARLWDGKTPDFRGIWQVRDTAYVNIEGHPAEKGVAAAKSIVVDPPDGKIPYKPEALARREENYRSRATADPSIKCYQAGVPRATYLATPLQILQSPGNFAIVYQENHAFRVFHPDTRPHFDNTDWWMGDTRYRWDGDTLVADVVAQTDEAWLDQAGNFHSTDVHIIERYRLTAADTLEYEARIEDPAVYTKTVDAANRALSRQAAGSAHRRGRVSRGRERCAAPHFADRPAEPSEVRLLTLDAASGQVAP